MRIDHVSARAIPDTRGRSTVEVTVQSGEYSADASAPSGKSTGTHEAVELRDADGGVTQAVENVNTHIATALVGQEFDSADALDALLIELDGTPNKSRLGANAILPVSIALMRLSALRDGIPLWKAIAERAGTTPSAPRLFLNVLNGGVHAGFNLPFQEYILVIDGAPTSAVRAAQQAFLKIGETLKETGTPIHMGDEGGYAPTFDAIEKPFELLTHIVDTLPNITIAIDAAASQLYSANVYHLLGKEYSASDLAELYAGLIQKFSIASIEDPFEENAHNDFARFTAEHNGDLLIVGDDLTCTNPARITDAIANKEINAVLIKPNQIGTVKEAIEAVRDTTAAGLEAVASHRSGETHDTFIADFAYGIGAYGLKAGGLAQRERCEKYNRLLAIERESHEGGVE